MSLGNMTPSSLYVWCVYLVFILFLNRSFEQLMECEDRNKLREDEMFVPKELNIASVFIGVHV